MDFGLAALGQARDEPRLTRIGSILGTPLYMAPEQLRGQPVDPRADQFSFCVSFYEALYGERPFAGENFPQLRDGGARRPPCAPPRWRSRVPRRLRAVLLRGLSVDRAHRFPDMDALVDAIEAARGGRPARGAAAGRGGRRRGAGAGAASLAWQLRATQPATTCGETPAKLDARVAAAPGCRAAGRRSRRVSRVGGARCPRTPRPHQPGAGRVRRRRGATSTARAARRPRRAASRPRCAPRASAASTSAPKSLAPWSTCSRTPTRRSSASRSPPRSRCRRSDTCADAGALEDRRGTPDNPAAAGKVQQLRRRLATLHAMAAAGHDWQALKPLAALVEEARTTGDQRLLADALLVYARARSPFDPEGAASVYEDAFNRGETLHNNELAAEAAIQLVAIVGAIQHHFDDGQRWARLAEAILERDPGGAPRLRGWLLHNRGTLHAARGRWRLAEGDFTAAVALRQQAAATAQPELATSMVHLARAVLTLDEPQRAMAMAERALAVAGAIFPADSFEVATARLIRGRALVALDRAAEARSDLEAVRRDLRAPARPRSPVPRRADDGAGRGGAGRTPRRWTRTRCSSVRGRCGPHTPPTVARARRRRSTSRARSGKRRRPIAGTRWIWRRRRATATPRCPTSCPAWRRSMRWLAAPSRRRARRPRRTPRGP